MSGVQSVERAFAVLRALAVGSIGVTELADKVDLPKSTVARLLSALESEGAVEQTEAGGDYRLGSGLAELAGATAPGRNLVAAARPFLTELTELTGETSGVSIIDEDRVFYLEHVDGDSDVQIRDWTGESAPLHAVPAGLVLLAHASTGFVDSYMKQDLEKTTDKSMVDPKEIRGRLADIRERGYSWVFEEFYPGINSVAAAVLDESGQAIAALHVHGPSFRFPDEEDPDRFGRLVADAASKLAAQLAE